MQRILFFTTLIICIYGCKYSPNKQSSKKHLIAFYNLENLFDTINTPNVNDVEFTPEGRKKWNSERYYSKLNNMSSVISSLGVDHEIDCPSILGVCEVENKDVLEDLKNTGKLKNKSYDIIHFDSPDKRGIDVALLYRPSEFKPAKTQTFPLLIYDKETNKRIYTRDQLLVSGNLGGDYIHIIVNHWPSRYGGKERSKALRKSAALLNRQIIDSLLTENNSAKILTMGDFNDDPIDPSINDHLDANAPLDKLSGNDLYNPLALNYTKGKGSLFYRGKWNLFDQVIISQTLINPPKGLAYDSAYIYNKPYLFQQEGDYKGYLLRTYGGNKYLNGYSDHLPVCMLLTHTK